MDLLKVEVSRFGPPKRRGCKVWTPPNVEVSRFGAPKR